MQNVTQVMVDEHRLILRMVALLEAKAALLREGKCADWDFFLTAVDFIRHYADRFHHAKEEDVLFRDLVRNGMPKDNSPVGAMLLGHDLGRGFVRALEEAALAAKGGDPAAPAKVLENAEAYVTFIRDHIDKEDKILYPLAERVLPADWREGMTTEYARAEAAAEKGLREKYRTLVERYEMHP